MVVSTLVVEWIEMPYTFSFRTNNLVSTLVVEWIEIIWVIRYYFSVSVSTLVVEWIEIKQLSPKTVRNASPPSWWSGLKSETPPILKANNEVSTLVVEWIEIYIH